MTRSGRRACRAPLTRSLTHVTFIPPRSRRPRWKPRRSILLSSRRARRDCEGIAHSRFPLVSQRASVTVRGAQQHGDRARQGHPYTIQGHAPGMMVRSGGERNTPATVHQLAAQRQGVRSEKGASLPPSTKWRHGGKEEGVMGMILVILIRTIMLYTCSI